MMGRKYPFSSDSRFGLICGQMRPRRSMFVKNAGWYNAKGEKLGWGDLSDADIQRIAASLRRGEMFILLHEDASWWRFVSFFKRGKKRSMRISRREQSPGKAYLAKHAGHVIVPRRIISGQEARDFLLNH